MYSSYHAGVSPEGGLEVGQTLWIFGKPLARKLRYSEAKWWLTKCILKSNTRQVNFRTFEKRDILNGIKSD